MFDVFKERPVYIIKLEPRCNHYTRNIMWIHLKTLNRKAFMPFVQSEEIFKQPTNGKRLDKSRTANKPNEKLIQQHKTSRNGKSIVGVPTSGVDRGRGVSRRILTVVMETAEQGSIVS